jgi:MoaD family protein
VRIRIRLYALLRDLYGSSEDIINIESERVTVKSVLDYLSLKNDKIKTFLESRGESIITLVNGLYAPHETELKDGDTIDLLPPASGGSL